MLEKEIAMCPVQKKKKKKEIMLVSTLELFRYHIVFFKVWQCPFLFAFKSFGVFLELRYCVLRIEQ